MDITGLLLNPAADGTILPVQVQPGAPRDSVVGIHDGALKLRISAPPVEGAANERCLKFLARTLLTYPLSRVHLVGGEHARRKLVQIDGASVQEVAQRLQAWPEPDGK